MRNTLPGGQRRAGGDHAVVGERGGGRQHAFDGRQHGVAQLTAVGVGEFRVGLITLARSQFTGCTLHEQQHGPFDMALHRFAKGADIVG